MLVYPKLKKYYIKAYNNVDFIDSNNTIKYFNANHKGTLIIKILILKILFDHMEIIKS